MRHSKIFLTVLLTIFFASSTYSQSDAEKRRQKLLKRLEKLQNKKHLTRQKLDKKMEKLDKNLSKDRGTQIRQLEDIAKGCKNNTSERCAQSTYMLANLYYEDARDRFGMAQESFNKMMDRWDKKKIGPPPVAPIPNYSKAIAYYERIINNYEQFSMLDNVLYRLGGIYTQAGRLNDAYNTYKTIVDDHPKSNLISNARLRVGDFLYMNNRPEEAIEYFKLVGKEVGTQNYALAQFRVASCLFAMGQYKDAIKQYYSYIDKCERKVFTRSDFKDEALEFFAKSFSELSDPITKARNFFKKIGKKKYEIDVYYIIGKTCSKNDKNEEAINALEYVLQRYPNYWHAPDVQRMIVRNYVILRNLDKANEAREVLIDKYGPGSKWLRKHSTNKEAIKEARTVTKEILALIPIYYHERAQRQKSKSDFEKAAKRYKQYIETFKENKWKTYEFSYYLAECYNELEQFEDAAKYYDLVSKAQISTFGKREALTAEEKKKKKKQLQISPKDAGYNAVIALQKAWQKQKTSKGLSDKDIYKQPITRKLINYTKEFAKRFPNSKEAPDILFVGANIAYDAAQYSEAATSYKHLIKSFPKYSKLAKVRRMMAQSMIFTKQYAQAITIYNDLLKTLSPSVPEYTKIQNSIASATYKIAEKLRKEGNLDAAIANFIKIAEKYSKTKVASIALFDAANAYEKQSKYIQAGKTFEKVGRLYKRSKLGAPAMVKAAEAYKKIPDLRMAAQTYESIHKLYPQKKHGLPSLSNAADLYIKVSDYNKAADVYLTMAKLYPREKAVDKILYNAGISYERAKNYNKAIQTYKKIGTKYAKSVYAADALFSIGLIYEKRKDIPKMLSTFKLYVSKYKDDIYKLVQGYEKIAEAYYKQNNLNKAREYYTYITAVYKKFRKKADINPTTIAKANYRIGEIKYKDFAKIKLTGSKKQINIKLKKKQKLLKAIIKEFGKSIKLGTEEWTLRSTYQIGMCFVNLGESVKNQTVRGSAAQKIAARILACETARQFYQKSEEYFGKNIEFGMDQDLSRNKWVRLSQDRFLEMRYRQAKLFEEAGDILVKAPLPRGLSREDKQIYREELEEKAYLFKEKALPIYESGVKAAIDLEISSAWLKKIKKAVSAINPNSNILTYKAKIKEEKKQKPKIDLALKQALNRINNIYNMKISTAKRIKQLKSIERDALRKIEDEKIKLSKLKKALKK